MTTSQFTNPNPLPPEPGRAPRRRRTDLKILAVVAVALVAFVAGILVRGSPAGHANHVEAVDAATAPATTQIYTCSMHPEIRNPGPGNCPICGMDLIPVVADEADDDAGPRTLSLSPRAAALLQVQTVPAQRRAVEMPLRFAGKLLADERRVVDVVVRTDSYIERLHANYTWMPVRQGDALAELFSPEVDAAARELLIARGVARGSPGTEAAVESAVARLQRFGVSDNQIEQMLASGEIPRTYTFRSPRDGFVSEIGGHEGHWLSEGAHLAEITDLSHLWLDLEAYETDLQWLAVGQEVQFSVQSYPGEIFTGTVSFIIPRIGDQTRTAQARVDVPNPDGRLMPGMFTIGQIRINMNEDSPLVIPASAPLITGRRAVVYVQTANAQRPTFEGREITLGPRAGDWYIVGDELNEGELVVTHGNFKLDSELQLRGRISMMSPEGAAGIAHDHHAHASARADQPPPQKVQAPPEFSEQIGQVVKSNFDLVTALADDAPQQAAAAAAATRDILAKVDMSLVKGAAHDVWMASHKQMDQALQRLAAAEDLKSQREHFEPFSDELTKVVRVFGTGTVAPVYRAMCPMVQGREAFWLQSWPDITNPYWGAGMYRCGEITETLVEADDDDRK